MTIQHADFGEIIGTVDFIMHSPSGKKRKVILRIGKPYEHQSGDWACPVELNGYEPRYADIFGVSSMQALCLAISLVRTRIHDFISKGGRITDGDADSNAKDVEALFGSIGIDDNNAV